MAFKQEIVFTTLPNGAQKGLTRNLSVLLSPRLTGNTVNAELSAFVFDAWTSKATSLTFKVFFGSADVSAIARAEVGAVALRDDLWDALFPSTTLVRSYAFEKLDNVRIESYAAANVAKFTETRLTRVATTSPDGTPPLLTLLSDNLFGKIAPPAKVDGRTLGGRTGSAIIDTIRDQFADSRSTALNIAAIGRTVLDPEVDFVRAVKSYDISDRERVAVGVPGKGGPDQPIDFHQMTTLLNKHPQLQRLLGFVFDLEVDLPGTVDVEATVPVWVRPVWPAALGTAPVFHTPRTKTKLKTFRPAARSKPSNPDSATPTQVQISKGLLNLTNTFKDGEKVFRLTQLDPDAAAFNLKRYATTLIQAAKVLGALVDSDEQKKGSEHAPPSQRSPGLTLLRVGRDADLKLNILRNFMNNKALVAREEVLLYADDLVRGYAIDVFDEQVGRWFKLCSRAGTATFTQTDPGIPVTIEPEDGWVSLAVTKAPPGSTAEEQKKLHLHESLFRWANWSLAARRPGSTVNKDEEVEKIQNRAETDFMLEVELHVPTTPEGVLPILRYGRDYRIRARVVDLAGNATPFGNAESTDFSLAAGPQAYDRLEPVSPPTLLMRKPITSGESLERVVVRSNYDTPIADTTPSERHVTPPKIDQFTAELHGMFDTPTGIDPSKYEMIKVREHGSFGEIDADHKYVHPGATADPDNFGQPYYDINPLSFPVESGTTSRLPYLPDPLSKGAAFVGLPTSSADAPTKVSFTEGQQWPETTPFLLRLKEGAESGFTIGSALLEVSLAKGVVSKINYSSYHEPDDIASLGLMRWIATAADDPQPDGEVNEEEAKRLRLMRWMKRESARTAFRSARRLPALELMRKTAKEAQDPRFWKRASAERKHLARIVAGTHTMAVPSRQLLLVHAVRQPLMAPAFADLTPTRNIGWTYVTLKDSLVLDRKATAEWDVHGAWTDITDHLDNSTGLWEPMKESSVKALAFKHTVDPPGTRQKPFSHRHEFGDTKYREVTYTAVATTRFKEYFTDRAKVVLTGDTPQPLPPDADLLGDGGVVPGSEKVKHPTLGITYANGPEADYTMDYAAGTITRAPASTIPEGDELEVEFISTPITRDTATGFVLPILSSARPAAPKVLYIVPTFGWERSETADTIKSKRSGKGLRVYLARPWWSSGAGELLGVLIEPAERLSLAAPKKLKPFLSGWGLDPLWRSKPVTKGGPKSEDFSKKVKSASKLSIEEVPGQNVSVAAHSVGFDEERRLWYCDIVLNTKAYFPFIRLALARYQPNSIPNAHLSRVVVADFIQLTPDRSLTITLDPADPTSVDVTLSGRSFKESATRSGPSVVEVTVEQRRPEVTESAEELGWVAVAGSITDLTGSFGKDDLATWKGSVPTPAQTGTEPLRLVIREYELLPTGLLTKSGKPSHGRRLIYVDTAEILGAELPTDPPDLTVSAVTSTSFTVKNIGLGDAGPFKAQLRDAQDAVLQTFDFGSGLGAGQTDTRQVSLSGQTRTIVVDSAGEVAESNENNNSASIPPVADLTISAATATSFTVKNIGAGSAGAFKAQLRDAGGTTLQTFDFPNGLAPDQTDTRQVTASSQPRSIVVDTDSQVTESNEDNNTSAIPTLNPDLVFTATTATSFTVKNTGQSSTGAFKVQLRDLQGAPLQTFDFAAGLAGGASETRTFAASSSARNVVVDTDSQVAESDETNNTASIPPVADLIITATTTTSFTVKNNGGGNAGAFKAQLKDSAGTVLSTIDFPNGLATGQSIIKPITASGAARTVLVDSAAQVLESNESNNTASIPRAPDLTISATTGTSFTVRNLGAVSVGAFRVDIKNSAGSTLFTYNFAGLAAGASITQSIPAANFARNAVADPLNAIAESSETNNTRSIPFTPA